MNNTSVAEREKTAEFSTDEGIKVRVSYPIEVSDTIRQQKLGEMYDIFFGALRRERTEEVTE